MEDQIGIEDNLKDLHVKTNSTNATGSEIKGDKCQVKASIFISAVLTSLQ